MSSMDIQGKIQDSLSESLDPDRQLMAINLCCQKEDNNESLEENSSIERKLEKHQKYPDAYDFRKRGLFACLVCFRKFTSCLNVKKHFIEEHPKAFCALGNENAADVRSQAKLLLFCPKNCQYVTLKMQAFTHHLATCSEPDFSSQENVKNQLDPMAENDDENDGQDSQAENIHILASKTEQGTKVVRQGDGSKISSVENFKESHTCLTCKATFTANHLLECHMKLHHGEKCGKIVQSHKTSFHSYHQLKYQKVKGRLQAEENKKHRNPDHCVLSCPRNDRVLKTFCEENMLENSSQLPLNSNTNNSSISLYINRRQLLSKTRYTCRKCYMNFRKIHDFYMHMVVHEKQKHANGKIRDETEQITPITSEQNKMKTVNGEHLVLSSNPLFECGKCKKSFHQNSALIIHMKSHRTKLHHCHQCNKVFKRNHCLSVHMRTHTGEKPCKCEECGSFFRTSGALSKHIKRHRGDRPFQCTICGNSFGAKSTLQTHLRTHTGEKPYQCAVCGKSFSQSGSLNLHMKIHTGEKPFTCEVCGRAFMLRVVLRKHMRTHGEKLHKCQECGKEFNNGSCFKWHLRSHEKKS